MKQVEGVVDVIERTESAVRFTQNLVYSSSLFCDGDWVESKDQDVLGDVRLIQLADIGDGFFINKSNRFMNIETAKRLNCTFLKKGDLLIARMPDPLGRCCVFPFDEEEKYVTVVDIAVLRLKESFETSYVKNMINSPKARHDIFCQITGATRQRITRKKLEKLKIPLPPLAEQKKVAAILDAADRLRQKDAQLIAKYNELSQSLFLDMFGDPVTNPMGWDRKSLSEIVQSVIDCPHSTPKWTANGKIAIRTSNLTKGGWQWGDTRFVSEEEFHNRSKRAYVKTGDVILSREGTIGVLAIVTHEMEICLGQRLVQVIPDLTVGNNYYLLHLLLLELEPERINRVMVGATSKHLNMKQLRMMKLPLPPITLQNQFAERIQHIEAQKQQAQASLEQANNLFNSLLQKAFTGELTA